MKKIIGTNTISYPEIRNFVDLPFLKYEIKKKQNFYKIPAHFYFKWKGKTNDYFWNTFNDFNIHNVELFHFFNALSVGKTPWITTFETSLPRWGNDKLIQKGLSLIANDSCKKIIAISDSAANIQRQIVATRFPEFSEIIESKLMVLHPTQKKIMQNLQGKNKSEIIRFTFIASDFTKKGGHEIIKVFNHLYNNGIKNWKLTIVSESLNGDSTSSDSFNHVKKIIAKYPDNITLYFQLPNDKILELLRETDVGLLPSYQDTYGYSILEAQASGCPTITTDIRAFPEINNDEIGWIIKVPKDEFGNGIYSNKKEAVLFSNAICDQLYAIIEKIIQFPESIKEKGYKALQKIDTVNSPAKNAAILEAIYDEISALNKK
ncbi:MAG: glycosyltransferase family 4 protein [Bacteroidia bacterium]